MEKVVFEDFPELFASIGERFAAMREELCAMDAKLGDGDLGLTMGKGFGELPDLMREEMSGAAGDVGKLLMKAGMKMSSLVPSTMGFLMSSGIMEGGKRLKGLKELNGTALVDYLRGFADGIQKRGKCQLCQRTVYDSVKPAADAAGACIAEKPNAELSDIILAAVEAAEQGVEKTKSMVPVFGKAAVHAAKCIGVPDQGAIAGLVMLNGMRDYILG